MLTFRPFRAGQQTPVPVPDRWAHPLGSSETPYQLPARQRSSSIRGGHCVRWQRSPFRQPLQPCACLLPQPGGSALLPRAASFSAEARISATSVSSLASRASISFKRRDCVGAGSLRVPDALLDNRCTVAEHLRDLGLQQHPEEPTRIPKLMSNESTYERSGLILIRRPIQVTTGECSAFNSMATLASQFLLPRLLPRSLGQLLTEFGIGILRRVLLGRWRMGLLVGLGHRRGLSGSGRRSGSLACSCAPTMPSARQIQNRLKTSGLCSSAHG